MKQRKIVKRTERGYSGHLWCRDQCSFHRNTLLELGDLRVIVSTVGSFRPGYDKDIETIGLNRYYETECFHAQWEDPYWEIDVSNEIYPDGLKWSIGRISRETHKEADEMHEAYVSAVIERMLNGEIAERKNNDD